METIKSLNTLDDDNSLYDYKNANDLVLYDIIETPIGLSEITHIVVSDNGFIEIEYTNAAGMINNIMTCLDHRFKVYCSSNIIKPMIKGE